MEGKKQKSKISKLKSNFLNLFQNLSINNKRTDRKEKAPSHIKTNIENNNHEDNFTLNSDTTKTETRSFNKSEKSVVLKNDEISKETLKIHLKSEDFCCPSENTKVVYIEKVSAETVTTDEIFYSKQSDNKSELFDNINFKQEDSSEDEKSECESNDESLFDNLQERGPDRNQRNRAAVRHVEYEVPVREIASEVNFHQIKNETIFQNLASEEEFFEELQGPEIEKVIVDIEIEERIAEIKRKEELEIQKRIVNLEIENRIAEIQARKEEENYFAAANFSPICSTGFSDLLNERENDESFIDSILQLENNILPALNLNQEEDTRINQLVLADSLNDSCSSPTSSINDQQIFNEIKNLNSAKHNLMQSDSFKILKYNNFCKEYEVKVIAEKEGYNARLKEEARLKTGAKVEEKNKAIYFLKMEGRKKYIRTNLHKAVMDGNLEETCAIVETHKRYYNNLSFTINSRDSKKKSVLDRAEETSNSLLIAYLKDNFAKNSIPRERSAP